jgi:hypothetical protein
MDSSVKLRAYSATEIYLAVHDYAAGSNLRFSDLLSPTLAPLCSLKLEYRNPEVMGTSQWFRGYIGTYRNPKWSRNGQFTYGGSWEYNQFCVSYSGCSYVVDTSIICGFDVSVPYNLSDGSVFIMYDGTLQSQWVEGEVIRSKYNWRDTIYVVPCNENTTLNAIDTSLTFRVAKPAEAGNEYQTLPDNAYFSLYQEGTPIGPEIHTYIDPNDKSAIELNTITAGQIASYNNVAAFNFNLDNPQYNTGENETIYWRAIRIAPASENIGTSSFLYPDNTQVNNASIYFTSVTGPGDKITMYLLANPLLYLNPMNASISNIGGAITINVSTSSKNYWIASEAQSWLSITNNSSIGNGQFIINVAQQSTGNNERSATVCVDSSAAQVCVTVTQDASVVIGIYRLYDPPVWEYGASWTYDQFGSEYQNASFGFDSSRNNVYYDASIVSFPTWITLNDPKGSPDWAINDSISPYASNQDMMIPYPNSANMSTEIRNGIIRLENNQGSNAEWTVSQSGFPTSPPPVTFTVDISMIGDGWMNTIYSLAGSNSYLRMYPSWSYVLKVTNPSTGSLIFPPGATIDVRAADQYGIITSDFFDYEHTLPSSILPGQTWEDSRTINMPIGYWQSEYFTETEIQDTWNLNGWSPKAYYNSTPYVDYVVDTAYTMLRRPVITLSPLTRTFVKSSGNQLITVSLDTTGISWVASEALSWISLTGGSGIGNGSFTINCDQQANGGAQRSGKIMVTSLAFDASVSVTQDSSIFVPSIPSVTTVSPITNISLDTSSASGGGNVTSDGGATVTARGVCWNTSGSPTISNSHTTNGSGTGSFTSTITPLTASTTFYVRAYATNSVGTAYGSQVSFIVYNFPTVTTISPNTITGVSAMSGGNVTDNGGSNILSLGVCWSKWPNTNPTTSLCDNSTNDGAGIGPFGSTMTGLDMSTLYYVKAYAYNAMGVAYGSAYSFITLQTPTIVTSAVSNITGTTATSGGESINAKGGTVSSKGVCWSTIINPTLANPKYTDGSGTGSFIGYIAGLNASTHYYVRAYVTTEAGTGFGQNVEFNTDKVPTVTTSSVTSIGSSNASCGGNVTSDGGETVTSRGVCWSTSINPSIVGSHSSNGTGTGIFYSNITSLNTSTNYYTRAYATNSVGTGYGSNVSFTTTAGTITLSDNALSFYNDGVEYTTNIITVTSTGAWTRSLIDIGYGTTWVAGALPSTGNNGDTCTLSISTNSTGHTRQCYVRFTLNGSSVVKDCTITQYA